jgi:hypothetical protein
MACRFESGGIGVGGGGVYRLMRFILKMKGKSLF